MGRYWSSLFCCEMDIEHIRMLCLVDCRAERNENCRGTNICAPTANEEKIKES